jgi:hypothetical protein
LQMPRKNALGERPVKAPIALPESLYQWLRSSAFARRVPMAEIVREAIVAYQGIVSVTTDALKPGGDRGDPPNGGPPRNRLHVR